jgi:hypothetical protein
MDAEDVDDLSIIAETLGDLYDGLACPVLEPFTYYKGLESPNFAGERKRPKKLKKLKSLKLEPELIQPLTRSDDSNSKMS